jgi:hypothetical protein
MSEFGNHFRGARTVGLTPNELRAVLTQITIYCGIAVGADCAGMYSLPTPATLVVMVGT